MSPICALAPHPLTSVDASHSQSFGKVNSRTPSETSRDTVPNRTRKKKRAGNQCRIELVVKPAATITLAAQSMPAAKSSPKTG